MESIREAGWLRGLILIMLLLLFACLVPVSSRGEQTEGDSETSAGTGLSREGEEVEAMKSYTLTAKVVDVIHDPVFEGYGRLIFPVDQTIDESMTAFPRLWSWPRDEDVVAWVESLE